LLYAYFFRFGRAAGFRLFALSRDAVVQGDMVFFEVCFDVIVAELGRGVEGVIDALEPCVVCRGRGRLWVTAAGAFATDARENLLPGVYLTIRDKNFLFRLYFLSRS
jgi:hypothetical protein